MNILLAILLTLLPVNAPDTISVASRIEKSTADYNIVDLGYADWLGEMKNHLPHDVVGMMTYKEEHLIDARDPKRRVAQPGDYVIGEWYEGRLVQGKWYDSTGKVKGSVLIGR